MIYVCGLTPKYAYYELVLYYERSIIYYAYA